MRTIKLIAFCLVIFSIQTPVTGGENMPFQSFENTRNFTEETSIITVLDYGATGDGVADDRSAIQSAVDAASGTVVLLPAGTYRIGSDLTVPGDVTLWFIGKLSVDAGVTATINGKVKAGLYQIFSGAGDVSLGAGVAIEILPQWWGNAAISTFSDGDTTPSVAQGRIFKTANTGATTITMFDDGFSGQVIRVIVDDANTTLDFTGTNLKGNGGADWSPVQGDSIVAVFDGADWFCAVDISDLKTDLDGFPDELKNLATAEIQQLENIGATTISAAQWGYVGGANQAVKTSDSPTFADATLSGRLVNSTVTTFGNGDTTPGVSGTNVFKTANTGATTITMFDDGVTGQVIKIIIGDNNTSFDFTGTNLKGNGGADWSPVQDDSIVAVFDGTDWYCQTGAADVSGLQADLDGFPDELKNLATAEIQQLESIGTTTISAAQWGYLGGADQALTTSDSPTFAGATLSGRLVNSTVITFGDGDATPSVSGTNVFKTANTGATTITMFDDGVTGQVIKIIVGDSNTSFDFTGTNLKGNGGADWSPVQGDSIVAVFDGADWFCAVDISELKADLDGFPDELKNLAAAEIQQLENIGATTITAGQWGYVGEADQAVKTSDSPTFAGATLSGRLVNSTVTTFSDGDATPSVSGTNVFKTANTGATTITMFDDGITGQVIKIIIGDNNTSFDFTGTNLKGNGGADWSPVQDDSIVAVFDGTDWYCQTGAADVSGLQADLDGFPDELKNLATAEIQQLENIGATTITAGQWGYVGEADQAVKTSDSPTFAGATLSGRLVNSTVTTFGDGDATPSVSGTNVFKTANISATTITMFDDGVAGQVIKVIIGDANTTLDFTGTSLKGNGGVDWSASQGDSMLAVFDGTDWYCQTGAADVSVLQADLDGFPDELKNLVTAEIQQLENIGATTITAGQWGYVGEANQAVKTSDSPTFAGATLSGTTASRMLATDGSKALISSDLASWVGGTANRVTVTDDGDGTVTLSGPQDLGTGSSPTFNTVTAAIRHKGNGAYDVRAYGATGNGSTDDTTAISNAAAAAAGNTLLFPAGAYRVASNISLDEGVVFHKGATLSIDSGVTVSFTGALAAGPYQIFSGDGDVALAAGTCEYVLGQWWGAVGDDSTDCHAAFESAIAALGDGGGMLYIPAGVYRVSAPIDNFPVDSFGEADNGITIKGSGVQTVMKYMGTSGYLFELGYDDQDSNAGVFYTTISDMRIDAESLTALDWPPVAPSGGGIELSKAYFNRIERVVCTPIDSTYGVGIATRAQNKSLTEDGYTHDTDKDFTFTGVGAAEKYAIKFTPSLIVAAKVKQVTVRLKQDGSANGTVHAEIWSDSSGPDVQIGEDSEPINCSSITTGATGEEITFTFVLNADMPGVANATDYWLVLSTSGYSAGTLTLLVDAVHSSENEVEVYDWGVSWSTSADGSNNNVLMRTAYDPMWNALEGVMVYGAGGYQKAAIALRIEDGGSLIVNDSNLAGVDGIVAEDAILYVSGTEMAATSGHYAVDITGGHTSWTNCYFDVGKIDFDGGARHSVYGSIMAGRITTTTGTPLTIDRSRPQLMKTSDPSVQMRDLAYKIYTADEIMDGYDGTGDHYGSNQFFLSSGLTLADDDYALSGKAIQFNAQNELIQLYYTSDAVFMLPRGTYLVSVVAKSTNALNDFYMQALHRLSDGTPSLMYRRLVTLTSNYETYKFLLKITDAEVTSGAYLYFFKYLADANTISISHITLEYLGPDTVTQHDTISYSSGEWDADGARLSKHLFLQKVLGAEVLDETDFATHASWDDTGDFDSESGNAAYAHSTGAGTLTQQSGNFANAATSKAMYRFQYTVSGTAGDPSAEITTAFAFEAQSLDLTDGTHVLYFSTKTSPGDFVISATSDSGGDAFTLDDVSIRHTFTTSALATITASHDGSSIDEKGKLELAVNDGDDGMTPSKTAIKIMSDGSIYMTELKSGTSQANAGASAGELWVDTDDSYVIKVGQ